MSTPPKGGLSQPAWVKEKQKPKFSEPTPEQKKAIKEKLKPKPSKQ